MKSKLIKAVLSIATVACLSVTAFQYTEKEQVQEAKSLNVILYSNDPGPGGG
ncbi:hypothetical protein [Bacillus mycoides]|uniref:hypothetical protein n=1 Tax=Bacillus mycoides TaxID=1405 RepID=UPI003D1C1FC6